MCSLIFFILLYVLDGQVARLTVLHRVRNYFPLSGNSSDIHDIKECLKEYVHLNQICFTLYFVVRRTGF
jgi:hypothetical protein